MNGELTKKLLKRFPVLYQDYDSPMTQTCMCWGFDHGDGWFEIIWQLSLAIEEELGYSWPRKRWYFQKRFLSIMEQIHLHLLSHPPGETPAGGLWHDRRYLPQGCHRTGSTGLAGEV